MVLRNIRFATLSIGIIAFLANWLMLALLFYVPTIHAFYETLESFVFNQIFVSTATPSEDLIVLEETEGPYNRETYGRLIAGLDRMGAKVIALDVLFEALGDPAHNAALIAATAAASNKVIHAMELWGDPNQPFIPDRYPLKIPGKPSYDKYLPGVRGALLPFEDLLQVTKHLGVITRTSDMTLHDSQHAAMIMQFNGRLYPALHLLAVMKFWEVPTDTLPSEPAETITFLPSRSGATTRPVPLSVLKQSLINFIPLEEFAGKRFSLKRALELIEKNRNVFENKIILVGNSHDSQEQTLGPRFSTYPSLFVYASLISQILHGENIREGTLISVFLSLLLVMLGIGGLISLSERFEQIRLWQFCLLGFLFFLLAAFVILHIQVRIMVILPAVVFCISHAISKFYFEKRLRELIGQKEKIFYRDYHVVISPKRAQEEAYPVVLVDSPAGEDYGELKFPSTRAEMTRLHDQMAESFMMDLKELKRFGSTLFEALFQPKIRDKFDKSLGLIQGLDSCLRLKLRIDAPELVHYPWEFMLDDRQTQPFLAIHKKLSVTRFLTTHELVPAIRLRPPLRILVAISSPTDLPELQVEEEKRMMIAALDKLRRNGIVKLRFLKEVTIRELRKELSRKVDVIHFIGHGCYSDALGGCLIFQNESKESELVNVDRLATLLEEKKVRLVFLNACQTAKTSESHATLGVAQGLIKIGIPAVIAMQFKIPDKTAIEFSKDFYTTFAETLQVDRAVSEARRNMFINLEAGRIDWGIPVLFMRKDDGIIFT